jgi:hypothetical protein
VVVVYEWAQICVDRVLRRARSPASWRFLRYPLNPITRSARFISQNPTGREQLPRSGGWDVAANGQRFLAAVPQGQRAAPASLSVILNWPALLKK